MGIMYDKLLRMRVIKGKVNSEVNILYSTGKVNSEVNTVELRWLKP